MANENFTEKVSVNINSSTLSGIDLLVDNGYYSNRSDFINQALRSALDRHQSTLDRIIEKNSDPRENSWFFGVCGYTRRELEELQREGQALEVRGYGVLVLPQDCPEELVQSVIRSIQVKGKVVCSKALREYYGI